MSDRRVPEAFTTGVDKRNAAKAWLDGYDTLQQQVASLTEERDRLKAALTRIKEMGHGGCYGGQCFCSENMRDAAYYALEPQG